MGQKVTLVHVGKLLVLHLLDVGSSGERLLAAGEHHGANGIIVGGFLERRIDLGEDTRSKSCSQERQPYAGVELQPEGDADGPLRALGRLSVMRETPSAG